MTNPSLKSNHEVNPNKEGENPLAGHNLPSRPVSNPSEEPSAEKISPSAALIIDNAREKLPLANVTKVQLAEAWTKVVCRYGSALNSADAIDSVLLARKFSEETGIKLPKKLNDMLGGTARRAIQCELKDALEGIFRTRFISISDVKTCILSALEIAKKTGIDPTNKQNAIIERFANYIIQGGLAEMSESAARKIYLNAANSVLPVLEIVKETKRELTTEQKKEIKENAPNMIQASLKRALWLLGEGYAKESLDYARSALKIAKETKTDLTKKQKEMIESIASDTIQYELAKASEYANSDESLRADAVRSVLDALKIAEETKTDLTKEQKKMIEDFASGRIQHELVHASRNADTGKSTDAVLRLLYAFKTAEGTGTYFTEKQTEMAARILMRLDKNFRGFIALTS